MRFLDDLRQDVRYSVRVLLQLPQFSSGKGADAALKAGRLA